MPGLRDAVKVRRASEADLAVWSAMRLALWPFLADEPPEAEVAEQRGMLANDDMAVFIAEANGAAIGFAEVSLRRDYVEGCETSPVGFLEGLFVEPAHRLRGVARALVAASEDWARPRGCTEFASNALLDNVDSHRMHKAIGFEEAERVVYFRKALR